MLARRFAALYPGIELQAKVANGSVLADALCENQLDLALLENSVSVPDLHTEPIGTDCLCAVLAPAHPLAQQAALTLQQLVGGRCCCGNPAAPRGKCWNTPARNRALPCTPHGKA